MCRTGKWRLATLPEFRQFGFAFPSSFSIFQRSLCPSTWSPLTRGLWQDQCIRRLFIEHQFSLFEEIRSNMKIMVLIIFKGIL